MMFKLKGNKAEVTDIYLGGDIKQVSNAPGIKCLTLSLKKYVEAVISDVEDKLAESQLLC